MTAAIKFKSTVTPDHMIRLPTDVPEGPVEIIVLVEPHEDIQRRAEAARRRQHAMGGARGRLSISEDFDEPLPPEVLGAFEGNGTELGHSDAVPP